MAGQTDIKRGAGSLKICVPSTLPILALGGELKSSICLLSGGRARLSDDLGELHDPAAYRNFVRTVERFRESMDSEPGAVACDMHPDYAATRFARQFAGREGLPVIEVQHHHAHAAACAAENGLEGPVIGLVCDGTGYGTDGTVWGCEILVCEGGRFTRAGHLDTFPLPGGDAAAVETWRPAAGVLFETYGPDWAAGYGRFLSGADSDKLGLEQRRLAGGSPLPRTSSLGRLFDGVASLLGICGRNRFEAEAPMALEAEAGNWSGDNSKGARSLRFDMTGGDSGGPFRIDYRPFVRGLVDEISNGRPRSELAWVFHAELAGALTGAVKEIARRTRISDVVLTGGCFANRFLSNRVKKGLQTENMCIHEHRRVPLGDGGIALGQAVISAYIL